MQNSSQIQPQKALIVVVQTSGLDLDYTLAELKELVRTANGVVELTVVQNRVEVDNATVVGKGKLQEIKAAVDAHQIDVVVFNNNLNAIQRRNIGEVVDCTIIDKTDLILDIFALHATTNEGKKQVELAQLAYSLASKNSKNFSRQGAGIGTRGPGETQLEIDKRRIREKIHKLKQELLDIEKQRDVSRKQRLESEIFTVAIVGYTNAGKSTLFNLLTQENTFAENLLFATLDTTTRKIKLKNQIEVLISDTVGFIKDLPHNLVEAFKATLDELKTANLILNVVDISDKNATSHMQVVEETLNSLGVTAPIIVVFNKIDALADGEEGCLDDNKNSICISAKFGINVEKLCDLVFEKVMERYVRCTIETTAEKYGVLLSHLNKYSTDFQTNFGEEGVQVTALLLRKYLHNFHQFDRITIL